MLRSAIARPLCQIAAGAGGLLLALVALAQPVDAAAGTRRFWREPPGAVAYPATLNAAIDRALRANAGAAMRFANRLALEGSPYLRRHADDAVDWWPWSQEAFAAARRLDRPVFLSIGYLACGGCHAMETECFENESLAAVLNTRYVAILVDREERPEVEGVYLRALRALGQDPGWPMTFWLLPDGRTFFAGTYYAAEDGAGGPGLRSLLEKLANRFRDDRARLEATAASLAQAELSGETVGDPTEPQSQSSSVSAAREATRRIVVEVERRFDWQHGGLAGAPKFPGDVPVRLLLAHDALVGDDRARTMAVRTLEGLMGSALRDPLAGGFHRYATDEAWTAPHFEKMLSDNALLVLAFLDGLRATGRPEFAAVARETLDFLLEELADPGGGFYASLDAVSPEGIEGGSYTWTREEIETVLGSGARQFLLAYRLLPGSGRGVLVPEARSPEGPGGALATLRVRLHAARKERPRPAVDDQLVLGSNALAISALARAGWILGEPRFVEAAGKSARRFLAARRATGLPHVLRRDAPGATLSDLAAFCAALIDLFEASGDVRWFAEARALEREVEKKFTSAQGGGYYETEKTVLPAGERLTVLDDSLAPSGNSLHLENLWRLAAFTGEEPLRKAALRSVDSLAGSWREAPGRAAEHLRAALIVEGSPLEIVIAVERHRREAEPFLRVLRTRHLPQAVGVVVAKAGLAAAAREVPLVLGKVPRQGQATAYLCRGHICQRPTADAEEFASQLAKATATGSPGT